MAGKIWQRKRDRNETNDGELIADPTVNVKDEATAGDGELTGPELETAKAHHDDDFADLDDLDTQTYVNPDGIQPPASLATQPAAASTPLTASKAIDGLARQYILRGYESLQRTPSPSLSDNYRAQLVHLRNIVNQVHKAGIKGIGRITATVVGVLAIDQRGKIDAVMFLRQLMRQAVWQASVDISRARRAEQQGQRRYGEDEERAAPMGMAGMSDHSDAIAGVTGSSEAVTVNEADASSALVEVNGFLSAFADTICDDENDRLYLGLEDGLAYLDKPGIIAGSWVGVFDVDEALDIQLIKNQESMAKRDEQRAARRATQLKALAAALDV